MQESYSQDIRDLVEEMLSIETSQRPEINTILQKPFMLKYIKLNLIRQISSNENKMSDNFMNHNQQNEQDTQTENNTRSNSSGNSTLNLKFSSRPKSYSQSSNSLSQKNSNSNTEEINVYKIESENSSKKSTSRLTIDVENNIQPVSNKEYNSKSRKDDKSIFSKVEKLKNILEKFLGLENFLEIYFKINVSIY